MRYQPDARRISMSTLRGIKNGPCLDSTEPFHLFCPACGWGAFKVICARHRKQFCSWLRGSENKIGGKVSDGVRWK